MSVAWTCSYGTIFLVALGLSVCSFSLFKKIDSKKMKISKFILKMIVGLFIISFLSTELLIFRAINYDVNTDFDYAKISDEEALSVLGREEIGRWPSYVEMLEQQKLIRRTDNDDYVLVRNLDQVDFWSFYRQLPYPLPQRQALGNLHPDDEWMEKLGPTLIETDDYLSAKLAIPLSNIFEQK